MMNLNECKNRLEKSIKLMSEMNISTLLITPGPNLRYLTGYKAKNLERLTCLVLKVDENPRLIVPELEKLAALESGIDFIVDDIELETNFNIQLGEAFNGLGDAKKKEMYFTKANELLKKQKKKQLLYF